MGRRPDHRQASHVVAWHRRAFARFWAQSRPIGRPALDAEIVALIGRMASENPVWSRRRIASELAKLGHNVDKDTVAKYMPKPARRPRQRPSTTWRVVTPGEILAEMDSVDAAVSQLDGEIGSVPVSAAFKKGWDAFAAEWRKFYQEHKALSGRIWTTVYRQTLAYRRRVEEWFGAFAREGWQTRATLRPDGATLPALPAPAVAAPPGNGYSLGTLAWIAAGAAVLSGLLVYGSKEE